MAKTLIIHPDDRRADDRCIEIAHTEEEAFRKYENVKANYVGLSKTVLKEEEI